MKHLSVALLCWCVGALWGGPVQALRDRTLPESQRVLVVANSIDPGSQLVALHYCQRRGIPEGNIVLLPLAVTETISWREFVDTVWEPLAEELGRRGWIRWLESDERDVAGRRVRLATQHAISYLVLCRGVPLRISHDATLVEVPASSDQGNLQKASVNSASVDSELAVLPRARPPLISFVANPLFENRVPTRGQLDSVLRVARLDGPSVEEAMALVDGALKAEAEGLQGGACVDIGGPYPDGDLWFSSVAAQLEKAKIPTLVDREPATFPAESKVGAPALYFGWYAADLNGPFGREGFRFAPGAIAYHLHSFSGTTLRSRTQGWAGPLVARGAAVSFGNVYEPYLPLVTRPDLLLRALLQGKTLGEASAYAQVGYSWQCVTLGDPLYRPFKK